MEVKEAISDNDILACWDTVVVLRPHLKKDEFVARVQTQQAEGYHLLYIRNSDSGIVGSILGYRVRNHLWSGKAMYIDDLCTLPSERGRGYAGALLDHVKKLAVEMDLNNIDLDSGYTRQDAHRLYLNKGFVMIYHHFAIQDVKALKGKVWIWDHINVISNYKLLLQVMNIGKNFT